MSKLLEKGTKDGEKYSPSLQKIMDEQKRSNEEFRTFVKEEVLPLTKEMKKEVKKNARQANKFLKKALRELQ